MKATNEPEKGTMGRRGSFSGWTCRTTKKRRSHERRDESNRPEARPRGKVEPAYADYFADVEGWLNDWEMAQTELAQLIRVEASTLSEALRGKLNRPWILERVRAITGIDPPEDERPIGQRPAMTRRYRAILVLLPQIEERLRIWRGEGLDVNREALARDLGELAGRAADFADWVKRSVEVQSPQAKKTTGPPADSTDSE